MTNYLRTLGSPEAHAAAYDVAQSVDSPASASAEEIRKRNCRRPARPSQFLSHPILLAILAYPSLTEGAKRMDRKA